MPAPMLRTPLRTDGAKIRDADGNPVKLASVNVSGFPIYFEQWVKGHSVQQMLDGVRQLGFNSIRLPLSSQVFIDPNSIQPPINRNDIAVNHPDFRDKTPIEMLDFFLAEAGKRGLGVILDLHKNRHGDFQSELWFQTGNPDDPSDTVFVDFNDPHNRWTDRTNESTFVAVWEALARRYSPTGTRKDLSSAVVGYDLFNEPHGRATWGDGGPTDWQRAAERAGKAIQQLDPSKLLFVEGIGADNGPVADNQRVGAAFWGQNLNRAGEFPVRLNNVVYSPHDYGPSVACQFWLCDTSNKAKINPTAMREVWERLWGYLARHDIAPVWVGELGQPHLVAEDPGGQQVRQLLDYLHEIGGHFGYWVLHDGASGDTGGVVDAAPNSAGDLEVILEKLEVLSHYLQPADGTFGQGTPVCLTGFVPAYEPFDTGTQSNFPPVPRNVQRVPIDVRPTVVTAPVPGCAPTAASQ